MISRQRGLVAPLKIDMAIFKRQDSWCAIVLFHLHSDLDRWSVSANLRRRVVIHLEMPVPDILVNTIIFACHRAVVECIRPHRELETTPLLV
jgi:hypothetical protein